jgi:hypothetical protein
MRYEAAARTSFTNAPWYLHTRVRVPRNMFRTKHCNCKCRVRRTLTRWHARSTRPVELDITFRYLLSCVRRRQQHHFQRSAPAARYRSTRFNPQAPVGCCGDVKQQRAQTIVITDHSVRQPNAQSLLGVAGDTGPNAMLVVLRLLVIHSYTSILVRRVWPEHGT